MTEQQKKLKELLIEFGISSEPISEITIAETLKKALKELGEETPHEEWTAEITAFDLAENLQDSEIGWGTYYGPKLVWKKEDGSIVEYPSISQITPILIDYWERRSREASHPVMRARYSDLVWVFSEKIAGKKPHFNMATSAIDSNVDIASRGDYKHDVEIFKKLERSLYLALTLNDAQRVEKVRDAIIAYEDKVAKDELIGLWGYSYDLLIENKKVPLTESQRIKIIDDLEKRLERISNPPEQSNLDPWAAERAANRLANYYRALDRKGDVKRVLLKYGGAFEKLSEQASAILAMSWLQDVYEIYQNYGLKEDAERIAVKLQSIGPKTRDEMKPISVSREIKREEMDKYVAQIIEGDKETALARVAIRYISRKKGVEKQLHDLSKKAPITFLFAKKIQDVRGTPIAEVGPLEQDLEGNIILQTDQNMKIESIFIRKVLDSLFHKFEVDAKQLVDYIYKAPIFKEERREIVLEGVNSYLENRHLTAIHLLVPQVEEAVRTLVRNNGGAVLKPARIGGGFVNKTLDELLRDPIFSNVFGEFGEDVALYLRILFTDRRGWNIRNCVCHGLWPAVAFGIPVADRIIHSILCLALVREVGKKD